MRKKNEFEYLEKFAEHTKYFLLCEQNFDKFDTEKANIVFIQIFNSVLFEQDENIKNKKVAYLVFWINFIIEHLNRQVEDPLLTTIMTIADKLDLHQLIQFAANELPLDFSSELNYETRKILDNKVALTDSQIDMFLAILMHKNIIVSAPTSYGKTGTILKSLLLALDKSLIKNFIVILPTKSLINEYRKNINAYFHNRLEDITVSETPYIIPKSDKAIFLFTQERYLIFNNTFKDFKFDYAVFDEVQDLANVTKPRDSERSVLLAKAISIVDSDYTPMIFLMPYISAPYTSFISKFITLDENNLVIIDKLYSPTSSIKYLVCKEHGQFYLSDVTYNRGYYRELPQIPIAVPNINNGDKFDSIKYDLYKICASPQIHSLSDKSLYFCRKDEISEIVRLFTNNIKENQSLTHRKAALINYLSEYIDNDFELINFIKKGVAIHNGDLDTFTKRQIETIFLEDNSGLNHIFCTSTLLRGVNLNANNLFFLAAQGRFNNAELDKKNLLGRVGRLGSCLQGRIFRFFVKSSKMNIDTVRKELNASSEPCDFSQSQFELPDPAKRSRTLQTYLSDKQVNNDITKNTDIKKEDNINCFDYFLGLEQSRRVQEKISNKSKSEIQEIIRALQLSNYECYEKVVEILSDIYDWANSSDEILSKRMVKTKFTTRLFYNVAIGTTIKKLIANTFEITHKNGEQPYVVTNSKGKTNVWFLTKEEYCKYTEYGLKMRGYNSTDKNILIYGIMADINDLIEYRLKVYLQDLYYRLSKITKERSQDLESFLTHSVVGNKKKIGLKNIGIVDDFAINSLCEQSQLFDENEEPKILDILNFAKSLNEDDPIRYSIKDIFGE